MAYGTELVDIQDILRRRARRAPAPAPTPAPAPIPKITIPTTMRGGVQEDNTGRGGISAFSLKQRAIDEKVLSSPFFSPVGGPTVRDVTPFEEYNILGTVAGQVPGSLAEFGIFDEAGVLTDYGDGGGDGRDGGGDGGRGPGPGGGGGAPSEGFPTYDALPLGLIPPPWYELNPDWASVDRGVRPLAQALNRLLPLFDPSDVPLIAAKLAEVTGGTGGAFADYMEAQASPFFFLPEDLQESLGLESNLPPLATRLVGAMPTLGGLSAAPRGLGQSLVSLAQGAPGTREGRIMSHGQIQDMIAAASPESRLYSGALQRLVEPTALRPSPGSIVFPQGGSPEVVRNPALWT